MNAAKMEMSAKNFSYMPQCEKKKTKNFFKLPAALLTPQNEDASAKLKFGQYRENAARFPDSALRITTTHISFNIFERR